MIALVFLFGIWFGGAICMLAFLALGVSDDPGMARGVPAHKLLLMVFGWPVTLALVAGDHI